MKVRGKACKTEILSDEEYLKMLDAKLDEELASYVTDTNVNDGIKKACEHFEWI